VLIVYIRGLFLSCSISDLILLLIFIEVLSWILLPLIKGQTYKYILTQSYFLICALLAVILESRILGAIFLFKLGAPPFHSWYVHVTKPIVKRLFLVFITLHKTLPLFVLGLFLNERVLILIFLSRRVLLLTSQELRRILLFSSAVHAMWGVTIITFSGGALLTYWCAYRLVNTSILSLPELWEFARISLILVFGFFLLSGVPPLTFFWLKFNAIYSLNIRSILGAWVILITAVMRITAYFRMAFGGKLDHSLRLGLTGLLLLSFLI